MAHVSIIGIRFKLSPFFRVEKAVSTVMECPGESLSHHFEVFLLNGLVESTGSMDRRQQSVSFTLTSDVVAKLQSTR